MAVKITPYGIELRKIRVDHEETQRDMANKLGFSATFLSMVEIGRRKIPSGMTNRIIDLYNIQPKDAVSLRTAESRSLSDVCIDLENASQEKKDAAVAVSNLFAFGDDDDFREIRKFIVSRLYSVI